MFSVTIKYPYPGNCLNFFKNPDAFSILSAAQKQIKLEKQNIILFYCIVHQM